MVSHVGVGPVFDGGYRGSAIAEDWGTTRLGAENMGPIVTRGVLLDVLGLKLAEGAGGVIESDGTRQASSGRHLPGHPGGPAGGHADGWRPPDRAG
jgi:hypothetical protein